MNRRAFTLVELLVVIVIIGTLSSLGFYLYGSIVEHGKRKKAAAELELIELKLNDFKLDNGFLPPSTFVGGEPPESMEKIGTYNADPTDEAYIKSSRVLFLALTGRTTLDDPNDSLGKSYYEPEPNTVASANETGDVLDSSLRKTYEEHDFDAGSYFIDPWGNPYGYYFDPENGNFKSFSSPSSYDVWSTGGKTTDEAKSRNEWVKSWEIY